MRISTGEAILPDVAGGVGVVMITAGIIWDVGSTFTGARALTLPG